MTLERRKGKSLFEFPNEYVVIDIETTGLSPIYDEIIEVAALKINNNKIIDNYSTLIKPEMPFINENGTVSYIDSFIETLTGISNEMLENAPTFEVVGRKFLEFISDSIIVGHNINFDINFIYDKCSELFNIEFNNDFCDLLRISRKLFPNYENHKLSTIARELSVDFTDHHRGIADCIITYQCFEKCKKYVVNNDIKLNVSSIRHVDLRKISSEHSAFDENHPLYGKFCVFTGVLEKMTRVEAAQLAVNCGAICENNVTQRTNFLILGNNDYCKSIKDGKSSKQKKAEKLILNGQDLSIMPEDVFYELLER